MKTRLLVVFLLLSLFKVNSHGQNIISNPYLLGDSIVIKLDNIGDSIQWQSSRDLLNWDTIPGQHPDSLIVVADTSKYIRAGVVHGDCPVYHSDVLFINQGFLPVAGFTADTQYIFLHDTVHFFDQSTMSPSNWLWDFGDGSYSVLPFPMHAYHYVGIFDVSLTVTNTWGTDVLVKNNHIVVQDTSSSFCPTTVSDFDGNQYQTVLIGKQCWMKKNLRVTHFPDGTPIPHAYTETAWDTLNFAEPAWSYYNNDTSLGQSLGALYNWAAIMNGSQATDASPSNVQGICPPTWHLPSNEEWKELEGFVDSQYGYPDAQWDIDDYRGFDVGKNLKATSTWNNMGNGTDLYGFAAKQSNYRSYHGTFSGTGYAKFWSCSAYNVFGSWGRTFYHGYDKVKMNAVNHKQGASVRCIKDSIELYTPTLQTDSLYNGSISSVTVAATVYVNGGDSIISRGVCWGTAGSPTVSGSHATSGTGIGSFSVSISNLIPNTTYYVRGFATNGVGTGYGNELYFTTSDTVPFQCGTQISDYDGNTYNTLLLDNQCWMKENLRTSHFADGEAVVYVEGNYIWPNELDYEVKSYCYYDYDTANASLYGYLYNWPAAMNNDSSCNSNPGTVRGICPVGWHLPSDSEWEQIEYYLANTGSNYDGSFGGGRAKIAKALAADSLWNTSSNTGAVGNNQNLNNSTGFSGLPGGYRGDGAGFSSKNNLATWWTSTKRNDYQVYSRMLGYSQPFVYKYHDSRYQGLYVRCVKD